MVLNGWLTIQLTYYVEKLTYIQMCTSNNELQFRIISLISLGDFFPSDELLLTNLQ